MDIITNSINIVNTNSQLMLREMKKWQHLCKYIQNMFIKLNLFVGPNNSYIVQAHFLEAITLHLIVKLSG